MEGMEALLRRYVQRIGNERDLTTVTDFVAPRLELNGRTTTAGEYREILRVLHAAFPDATWSIDQLLTVGDMATMRLTTRATHGGMFLGLPATGRRINFVTLATYRFLGGKIVEIWFARDLLGIAQQLGATLSPLTSAAGSGHHATHR